MTLLVKHIYSEKELSQAITDNNYKGYLQVKANGVYCEISRLPNGTFQFMSRQGKPFNITERNLTPDQWRSIVTLTTDDLTLLGELTVRDQINNFHLSSGECRKKEVTADLTFYCFAAYVNGFEGVNEITNIPYPQCDMLKAPMIKPVSFMAAVSEQGSIEAYRTFLGVEGFVYYTSDVGNWTPDRRTDQVIAYKPVVKFTASLLAPTYNTTVRGDIITAVQVKLANGTPAVLGSGIDDELRSLIERLLPTQYSQVTFSCEALDVSDAGVYQQPRIKGWEFSGQFVQLNNVGPA